MKRRRQPNVSYFSTTSGPISRLPRLERIRAKIRHYSEPHNPGECWPWKGCLDPPGYGQFYFEGTRCKAHQASYRAFKGPVPPQLEIDHLCRNRSCVNPDHLEAVTHAVNQGRGKWARRSHCKNGHPYDVENTRVTPKGSRACRACNRENVKRHYLRWGRGGPRGGVFKGSAATADY